MAKQGDTFKTGKKYIFGCTPSMPETVVKEIAAVVALVVVVVVVVVVEREIMIEN